MAEVPTVESAPAGPRRESLARRILSGFGVKVGSTLFGFLFGLIIARLLGKEGAGAFTLAQGACALGAIAGKLGMDNIVVRRVAQANEPALYGEAKGVVRTALLLGLVGSAAAAGLVALNADWVAGTVLNAPTIAPLVRLIAVAIVPFALSWLLGQALVGLKRTAEGLAAIMLVLPVAGCVLSLVLVPSGEVGGAVLAYTLSSILAVGYAGWRWSRTPVARSGEPTVPFPFRAMLKSSLPLYAVALVQAFWNWSPFFFIGMSHPVGEVGIMRAALNLAQVLVFALAAVNFSVSPLFAELYKKGDLVELERVAKQCAIALTAVALVPLLPMVLAPGWVMSIYGQGFAQGATVLIVAAIGQFVNVATGAVQQLLMMTDNEGAIGTVFMVLLLPFIGLMLWLVPPYGALGAAIASSTVLVLQNVACAVLVKQRVGIWTLPGPADLLQTPKTLRGLVNRLRKRRSR